MEMPQGWFRLKEEIRLKPRSFLNKSDRNTLLLLSKIKLVVDVLEKVLKSERLFCTEREINELFGKLKKWK